MKKIFYLGHPYHKKTKSFKFFTDIIEKYYSVDFYWVDPEYKNIEFNLLQIKKENYFAHIFFQVIPSKVFLDNLNSENIILIPMYDFAMFYDYKKWFEYKEYKFINFSKTLHDKLSSIGFNSLYLQYFPKVDNISHKINKQKYKVFFWQRGNILSWDIIRKLLPFEQISGVHIHRIEKDIEKDIWAKKYSDSNILKYNITFSSWFETKNEFQDKLNECDIFIAPRLFEGIGMTFLEAMSLGKCVVSPNFPTMNEYIVHKRTGLLFDIDNPIKLDLSKVKEIGLSAQKYINDGYIQWKEKEKEIIDFIKQENISDVKNKYQEAIDTIASIKSLTVKQQESLDLVIKYSNFIFEDIEINKLLNKLYGREGEKDIFMKNINQVLKLLSDLKKGTVIYGASNLTKLILPYIKHNIELIVDIDKNLWGTTISNIIIESPVKLKNLLNVQVLILVLGREKEVIDYLQDNFNINRNNIICLKIKDFKPL